MLLLAAEPMSETELAQAVGVPEAVVAEALAELVAFYDETGRGFELRELGGGWRYYTREEHADLVSRYVLEGQQAKLSQAALETLGRDRLQPADLPGPGVGRPRGQRRRGDPDAAGPRADRGGRARPRVGCGGVRHHQLLPGADGAALLDDLPPLAPHLPAVEELEAELGQLAETQAVPDEPASPPS